METLVVLLAWFLIGFSIGYVGSVMTRERKER